MVTTERHLRGVVAAHSMHAKNDPIAITAAGRKAFMAKFERQADPDGTLSPEERERRVHHLRQAYFAKLTLKSIAARRRRAQQRQDGGES
jgi:hypothetical protein